VPELPKRPDRDESSLSCDARGRWRQTAGDRRARAGCRLRPRPCACL